MNEENINLLLQIVLLIFGGGIAGGGLYLGGRKAGKGDQAHENAQLAAHFENRYNEANEERLKLVTQLDVLESKYDKQTSALNEVTARLTILKDDYEKRHESDLATFAEYMKGQGRLEAQLDAMQRELSNLKTQFEAVKRENDELRPLRELVRQQTVKITELEQRNRELVSEAQILKDQLRILKSRDNPEPDPPSALPKTGTDA